MLVLFMYWVGASSKGAFFLLCGYFVYSWLMLLNIHAEHYSYYYVCASFINLVVGYFLQKVNIPAAICSYSLVFINIHGFYLWYAYLPPADYDNICAIILLTQLALLTPKGLFSGYRDNSEYTADKPRGFDSF
jgi:hypothetical protein